MMMTLQIKHVRPALFHSGLFCAALMALGAPAQAADSKGLYQTLYYVSCATYVQDRKEPENTGKNAVDKIYVSGWLSGYNYLTPNTYDILPNHNVDTVLQWLDQYCAKSPNLSIEAGLLQLTSDLYPDRVQNLPEQPAAKANDKIDDLHFHVQDK